MPLTARAIRLGFCGFCCAFERVPKRGSPRRLDQLLALGGEAYVYVLQMVVDGAPLIARQLSALAPGRHAEFTPVQEAVAPFEHYRSAYLQLFPSKTDLVEAWGNEMRRRYGDGLGVQHCVMRVLPISESAPSGWSIQNNLAAEYGDGFAYAASVLPRLVLGRAIENLIRPEK